ncbi:MAG: hypothetical protein ACEPOV_01200 [Hyphomicrobiales bacterium]
MKNIIRKSSIIYLLVGVLCFSCTTEKLKQTYTNELKLLIYDSIDLKDGLEFQVKSYNPKTKLYTLIRDKSIVGFNKKEEVFSFNKYGKGPDEYTFSNSYTTCPLETSRKAIYINSDNYLKSFDFNGNLLSSNKIDDDVYYADRILLGRNNSNSNVFYFKGKGPSSMRKEDPDPEVYSDSPSFFSLNLENNNITLYGSGIDNNILKKEINTYSLIFPKISYNRVKSDVGVLYGSVREFFSIPLDTTKKITSFKLNPNHYNIPIREKEPKNDLEYRKKTLSQAAYAKIYYNADTLISVYRAAFSNESIAEIANYPKYSNFFNSFAKYYFDIYIKKEKVSNDILVPKPYKVALIGNSNNILLYKTGEELTIDNQPIRRLYFAKLADVKE